MVARYGAALALIKEHGELTDKGVEKIHAETGIDILDVLAEETQWFMLEGDELSRCIPHQERFNDYPIRRDRQEGRQDSNRDHHAYR